MSLFRRRNANVAAESSAILREAPAELPADGSIQLAYTQDGNPVYVYYDYDANVYRNYQTDEEISLDGLYEESGTPFHFFAEESTESADESAQEQPAAETASSDQAAASPADVMSQNTESIEDGSAYTVAETPSQGAQVSSPAASEPQVYTPPAPAAAPTPVTPVVSQVATPAPAPTPISVAAPTPAPAPMPAVGQVQAPQRFGYEAVAQQAPVQPPYMQAAYNYQPVNPLGVQQRAQAVQYNYPNAPVNFQRDQLNYNYPTNAPVAPAPVAESGVSQVRANPHVRGIVEYILNGNGNVDRISEKEQELFDVKGLKESVLLGYSDLVATVHERRRGLGVLVNESIATIRSIIASLVNENKQYCIRIKENARIVSEKQFVIYDELATNFQGVVQSSSPDADGSNYEQMKTCYIECWNLRKKILENLRIMYDFEIVITRLQYLSDAYDLTASRILGALNIASKEVEASLFDFTAACGNRELIGQNVVLSEGVKRFRESSRALLNEVDSVLVGIDKRRLFERWSQESERPRVPARFEKIRQDLPTMQIGNMSFLNEEGAEQPQRKNEIKRPAPTNYKKNVRNADFVSLSPTSTLRIDEVRR